MRERVRGQVLGEGVGGPLRVTSSAGPSNMGICSCPRGCSLRIQQPRASRRVRHTSAMRGAPSRVMRRRSDVRGGTVWRLSKLTTQSVGTPSRARESFNSENQSAFGARECGHHYGADPGGDRVAGQHQHRAVSVRRGGEPDFTASHARWGPWHPTSQTTPRRVPSRRLRTARALRHRAATGRMRPLRSMLPD